LAESHAENITSDVSSHFMRMISALDTTLAKSSKILPLKPWSPKKPLSCLGCRSSATNYLEEALNPSPKLFFQAPGYTPGGSPPILE
jgi:hypothetical protein